MIRCQQHKAPLIALTFPLCVLDSRTMECTDGAEECPKDRPPEHGNRISPCHLSHDAILTVFEHTNQFWPHQVQVLLPKITHLWWKVERRHGNLINFNTNIKDIKFHNLEKFLMKIFIQIWGQLWCQQQFF